MLGKNPKTSWKDVSSPDIDESCSIAATASVIGNVRLGKHINVAPGASIRSDEGERIVIGDDSNVQDNVVVHCLKGGEVVLGKKISLAHCAIIHGPVHIKDGTFVGFGAVVASTDVGERCFISHNATVLGVKIGNDRFVPPGTVVQTQEEADGLGEVPANLKDFNDEVIEVNCELAKGYKGMLG
ncbi:MAG TPA: carbonate dehydratase [Candidatus Methanofastidiosa archaeon]|nr:carbonate dehydratase [Candidatus Methanofastidiosa archaeon]